MPIMEETGLRNIEENCVRKFLDGKKYYCSLRSQQHACKFRKITCSYNFDFAEYGL